VVEADVPPLAPWEPLFSRQQLLYLGTEGEAEGKRSILTPGLLQVLDCESCPEFSRAAPFTEQGPT